MNRIIGSDWERSFVYDFSGRIRMARTGAEARDETPGSGDKIPYRLDYAYDAFDNNTQRSGDIWFGSSVEDDESLTWSATTNKVSGWDYDAAGNVTYSDDFKAESTTQTYTHNAAGSTTSTFQSAYFNSTRTLDGEQRLAKLSQGAGEGNAKTNVMIYSSFFGKVLTEATGTGGKDKTYVHDLGGSVIAVQEITKYSETFSQPEVRWEHTDPSGNSYLRSRYDASAYSYESAELDPNQRAVRVTYEALESEEHVRFLGHPYFGDDKACQTGAGISADCSADNPKSSNDDPPRDCKPGFEPKKDDKGEWQCVGVGTYEVESEPAWEIPDFLDASSPADDRDGMTLWMELIAKVRDRKRREAQCDNLLKRVFGGPNSVIASLTEPTKLVSEVKDGNEVLDFRAGSDRSRTEFASALHVYGDERGMATSPLYIPPNANGSPPRFLKQFTGESAYSDGPLTFTSGPYSERDNPGSVSNRYLYQYSNGLTILAAHVSDARAGRPLIERNANGSYRIGSIGGPGGRNGNFYVHSHLSFWMDGKRINPRKYFCGL